MSLCDRYRYVKHQSQKKKHEIRLNRECNSGFGDHFSQIMLTIQYPNFGHLVIRSIIAAAVARMKGSLLIINKSYFQMLPYSQGSPQQVVPYLIWQIYMLCVSLLHKSKQICV